MYFQIYPYVCQDKLDSMRLQPPGQKSVNPSDQPVASDGAIQQPTRRQTLQKVSQCL